MKSKILHVVMLATIGVVSWFAFVKPTNNSEMAGCDCMKTGVCSCSCMDCMCEPCIADKKECTTGKCKK